MSPFRYIKDFKSGENVILNSFIVNKRNPAAKFVMVKYSLVFSYFILRTSKTYSHDCLSKQNKTKQKHCAIAVSGDGNDLSSRNAPTLHFMNTQNRTINNNVKYFVLLNGGSFD